MEAKKQLAEELTALFLVLMWLKMKVKIFLMFY